MTDSTGIKAGPQFGDLQSIQKEEGTLQQHLEAKQQTFLGMARVGRVHMRGDLVCHAILHLQLYDLTPLGNVLSGLHPCCRVYQEGGAFRDTMPEEAFRGLTSLPLPLQPRRCRGVGRHACARCSWKGLIRTAQSARKRKAGNR